MTWKHVQIRPEKYSLHWSNHADLPWDVFIAFLMGVVVGLLAGVRGLG